MKMANIIKIVTHTRILEPISSDVIIIQWVMIPTLLNYILKMINFRVLLMYI